VNGLVADANIQGLYVERVVEVLYTYLLRIDEVRGTGGLYLP
jgi:hypothetical protein